MKQQKQDDIIVHSLEKYLDAITFVPHWRFSTLASFQMIVTSFEDEVCLLIKMQLKPIFHLKVIEDFIESQNS